MSVGELLRKAHNEVLMKVHSIETQQIQSLQETLEKYPQFVKDFTQNVETVLFKHFKLEEEVLFPILDKKVESSTIQFLLIDHERIRNIFHEYLEYVQDFDHSIQLLKNFINYLNIHAKKEEEFFSSITLSDEELKQIDETARASYHV